MTENAWMFCLFGLQGCFKFYVYNSTVFLKAGGSSGTVFAWDLRWQQQPIMLSGVGTSDLSALSPLESDVWEVQYDNYTTSSNYRNMSESRVLPAMICSEDGILAVIEQGMEHRPFFSVFFVYELFLMVSTGLVCLGLSQVKNLSSFLLNLVPSTALTSIDKTHQYVKPYPMITSICLHSLRASSQDVWSQIVLFHYLQLLKFSIWNNVERILESLFESISSKIMVLTSKTKLFFEWSSCLNTIF